jgi:DNA-binding ferritin-like protein
MSEYFQKPFMPAALKILNCRAGRHEVTPVSEDEVRRFYDDYSERVRQTGGVPAMTTNEFVRMFMRLGEPKKSPASSSRSL